MKIAVIPGDGIGPEIVAQGLRALEALQSSFDLPVETFTVAAGAQLYADTGVAIRKDDFQATVAADAVYLGAIGLPHVRYADGTEINGELMCRWRRDLDLYANIRPLRSFPSVPTIYAKPRDVDMIVVREGTEGLYAANGGGAMIGDRIVSDPMIITREGSERVSRIAFELARKHPPRNGNKPKVTCLDKANIIRGFALFRRSFETVARAFPDVEAEALYADAASTLMTLNPERYHVVVCENLLGDIFSDLAAAYVGGLGLAGSGEIGDQRGLFQSAHGSAPTLTGKNVANPIAQIISLAMLLGWWADRARDKRFADASAALERAIGITLSDRANHTGDLGGSATTSRVGDAVVAALSRSAKAVMA